MTHFVRLIGAMGPRTALGILFAASLSGDASWAEETILQPGSEWEHTFVDPTSDSNWKTVTGSWPRAPAPFGSTTGLDPDFSAVTPWPPDASDGDDLWLRTTLDLTGYDRYLVQWMLGVDNGYTLFLNGNQVSTGNAEGYASRWEYAGTFPVELLQPTTNVVALALEDHGGETAFDMTVTGWPRRFEIEAVTVRTLKPIDKIALGEPFRIRLTFDFETGYTRTEIVRLSAADAVPVDVEINGSGKQLVSDPVTVISSSD